jgi:hypothetical protein
MTTTAAVPTDTAKPAPRVDLIRILGPIARDVALPVGAYFGMHALGYSDFAGLLAGTLLAGAVLVVETVRSRRVEPFAAIMLGVFVFGLAGSLISGDPRIMIVKDSAGTAIVGLAFLISVAIGKPMTYLFARKALTTTGPAELDEFDSRYRTEAAMRRRFAGLAIMWGGGLIAEATVRVLLAYQLPIHTMAWLSPVLMIATITTMLTVSIRSAKRHRHN